MRSANARGRSVGRLIVWLVVLIVGLFLIDQAGAAAVGGESGSSVLSRAVTGLSGRDVGSRSP
jgi:hypothetical protein